MPRVGHRKHRWIAESNEGFYLVGEGWADHPGAPCSGRRGSIGLAAKSSAKRCVVTLNVELTGLRGWLIQ
jgi:hypothetical protein